MNSRLLDYIPEFLPPTVSGSKPGGGAAQEEGSEIEHGAILLEADAARELPRFLVKLVMDSGPGEPALRVRAALALAARRHAPGLLKRAARAQPR